MQPMNYSVHITTNRNYFSPSERMFSSSNLGQTCQPSTANEVIQLDDDVTIINETNTQSVSNTLEERMNGCDEDQIGQDLVEESQVLDEDDQSERDSKEQEVNTIRMWIDCMLMEKRTSAEETGNQKEKLEEDSLYPEVRSENTRRCSGRPEDQKLISFLIKLNDYDWAKHREILAETMKSNRDLLKLLGANDSNSKCSTEKMASNAESQLRKKSPSCDYNKLAPYNCEDQNAHFFDSTHNERIYEKQSRAMDEKAISKPVVPPAKHSDTESEDEQEKAHNRETQRLTKLRYDIHQEKKKREQIERRGFRRANAAPGETIVDSESERSTPEIYTSFHDCAPMDLDETHGSPEKSPAPETSTRPNRVVQYYDSNLDEPAEKEPFLLDLRYVDSEQDEWDMSKDGYRRSLQEKAARRASKMADQLTEAERLKREEAQEQIKRKTAWWNRGKTAFQRAKASFFSEPKKPVAKIDEDSVLYPNHMLMPLRRQSPLQEVAVMLIRRLVSRRTSNDAIMDSTYFVREFFLTKAFISLRTTRSSDIPMCFVPPTLNAGYFPHSAVTEEDQKEYLECRYKEAQLEYLKSSYYNTDPEPGFLEDKITADELLSFHRNGRHIHGYFSVWITEETHYIYKNDEKPVGKRYLVDMFFKIKFPLYVGYEHWEYRLKFAFDKVIVYNLHLSEIVRINRPVFDCLIKNPSIFKPITNDEIVRMMKEKEVDPKYFTTSVGKYPFYDWGRRNTNANYLSAFMIVCGGTKLLQPNSKYKLTKPHVMLDHEEPNNSIILAEDGTETVIEKTNSNDPVTNIIVSGHTSETAENPLPIHTNQTPSAVTRVIFDMEKEQKEDKVVRKRPAGGEPTQCSRLTRKQLINVRRKIYNYREDRPEKRRRGDKPEKPPRKKPGRKPETLQDKGLKKHDFNTKYPPSDIESEYEGYLSQSEDIGEEVPKLKRSRSCDSFLLDEPYKEYRFRQVEWYHKERLYTSNQAYAEKRKRKMNHIRQKHTLRYFMLDSESLAFKEMLECYHGNMPKTNFEIAKTKNCIRNPYKFEKLNVPRVYGYGDAPFIDTIAEILKLAVTHTVAVEHASTRAANGIAHNLQKSRSQRRDLIKHMPPTKKNDELPGPQYLAMEFFTLERVTSRAALEYGRLKLCTKIDDTTDPFMNLPRNLQVYRMRMLRIHQADVEFDEFFIEERERYRQNDKMTLKTITFDQRSLQAQHRRDHERRMSRKAHAQKISSRAKMAPEVRAREERLEKERRGIVLEEKRQEVLRQQQMKKLQSDEVSRRMEKEAEIMAAFDLREEIERGFYMDRRLTAENIALTAKYADDFNFEWEEERNEAEMSKYEKKRLMESVQRVKKAEEEKQKRIEEEAERRRLEEIRIRKEEEEERKKKEEQEAMINKYIAERQARRLIEQKEEEEQRRELMRKRDEKRREERERKRLAEIKAKEDEKRRIKIRQEMEKEQEILKKIITEANKKSNENTEEEERIRKEKAAEAEKIKKEQEEAEKAERLRKEKEKAEKEAAEKEKLRLEAERKKKIEELNSCPDVDLLTLSKNPSKYKAARDSFRSLDCREVILRYAELFGQVVLNSLRTTEDELGKYLESLAETGDHRPFITTGCELLYENIASSFLFKKDSNEWKEWMFNYNLLTLLKDIPCDVREVITKCVDKHITDPDQSFIFFSATSAVAKQDSLLGDVFPRSVAVSYCGNPLNLSVLDASVQSFTKANTSVSFVHSRQWSATPKAPKKVKRVRKLFNSANSTNENGHVSEEESSWNPPEELQTTFWKLVKSFEDSEKFLKDKANANEDFAVYLTNNPNIQKSSVHWIFGILGACYVLLAEKKKQDEKLDDFIHQDHQYDEIRADKQVKSVVRSLVTIGSFFQAAQEESPKNLEALIAHNGFYIIFGTLETMIQTIYELFSTLNISTFVKSDVPVVDALLVIFNKIGDECERMIVNDHPITAAEASIMRNDESDTASHILEKRTYHPSRLHRDLEHEARINTIIKWCHAVKTHHAEEISDFKHFSLQKAANKHAEKLKNLEVLRTNVIIANQTKKRRARVAKLRQYNYDDRDENNDGGCRSDSSFEGEGLLVEDQISHLTESIYRKRKLGRRFKVEYTEESEDLYKIKATLTSQPNRLINDAARRKRMVEIQRENMFPSKLPTYSLPFVQYVWKHIERSFYQLSNKEKDSLRVFNRSNNRHVKNSLNRFHPVVYVTPQSSADVDRTNDPNSWALYHKKPVEDQTPAECLEMENSILSQFDHTVLTKEEFAKMKWEVPRSNAITLQALEFFSDLEKFRSGQFYRKYAVCGFLPFNFYVYHHLWFMGDLLPATLSPDSHEDLPNGYCAGCTEGTVFIIPNCACEDYRDAKRNKFIYTRSKKPIGAGDVSRLVGRFVCEHGPSSYLVLENMPSDPFNKLKLDKLFGVKRAADRSFTPDLTRCVSFNSKLRVVKRKTMYSQLLQAIRAHPKSPPAKRPRFYQTGSASDCSDLDESIIFEDSDDDPVDIAPLPIAPASYNLQRKAYQETKRKNSQEQEALQRESRERRLKLRRTRSIIMKRRIRSNSADVPVRDKPGTIQYLTCAQSCTNLTELTRYAEKKIERTKNKLRPLSAKDCTTSLLLKNEEMLDGHTLFNGVTNADEDKRLDIFYSVFECGWRPSEGEREHNERAKDFDTIRHSFKQHGLLQVFGETNANRPQFNRNGVHIRGKLSSATLNLYYKLKDFEKDLLKKAERVSNEVLYKLKTPQNRDFKNLFVCYEKIFRFNVYLVKHMFELATTRIFNTCAVYAAERTRNAIQIENNVKKFCKAASVIMNQLFNIRSLKRQLDDLCELKRKVSKREMQCHVASLCRYAINRIRVPQTAEKVLDDFSWINHSTEIEETYDTLNLSVDETNPRHFDFDQFVQILQSHQYITKYMKFAWNSYLGPRRTNSEALTEAFFGQARHFFDELAEHMPNRMIDQKIKTFYLNQFFVNFARIAILKKYHPSVKDIQRIGPVNSSVMISALVETKREEFECFHRAHSINTFFEEMLEFKAEVLPVHPAISGTIFVCFEKNLCFSVVKEKTIDIDETHVSKRGIDISDRIVNSLSVTGSTVIPLIDVKTNALELVYNVGKSYHIDDRFPVAPLEKSLIVPKPNWRIIQENVLAPQLNRLFDRLKSLKSTNPIRTIFRVGCLEHPIMSKKTERTKECHRSVRFGGSIGQAAGSDTEDEN